MRNMWLILRRDVPNLFRNAMSVIITIGLVMLPSLFAWYNILACWDVFNNTGNLSVAVASEDAGFESDLISIRINIGDEVVSSLRANDDIDWVITDPDDAVEGAKSGKYYAALVLPEDFSKQLMTFYEGESGSARIDYYVNMKKNAIAPNIIGIGADTVSNEVNETFTSTMSNVAVGLIQSLADHADEDGVDERIAALTEHIRSVSYRVDQTADVLELYSSLGNESKDMLEGAASMVETAQAQARSTTEGIAQDKQKISGFGSQLASSASELDATLDDVYASIGEVESHIDALSGSASADAYAVAGELRAVESTFDGQASDIAEAKARLEALRADLDARAHAWSGDTSSDTATDEDARSELSELFKGTIVLDEAIAACDKALESLGEMSAACERAAASLEGGGDGLDENVQSLQDDLDSARVDLEGARSEISESMKPAAEKLAADIEALSADLERCAEAIDALGGDLPGTARSVGDTLSTSSGKLEDACAQLRSAAQNMRNLADAVDAALVSGDTATLRALFNENANDLASALSAPVQVERTALFPSDGFGSSMAPLYCALAVFIGALLIMVAMKPNVSRRGVELLDNPRPHQLFLGHFGVVALLSLAQTTLLGLGCMLFLKVQVTHPLLFMLAFWITGLVLSFIVYALVASFANLGKAIAVILLIVQVTACGGSYPLQILPDFVQAVSPWVPATYVVDALRAAMMGVYNNDFWIAIGHLVLFVIPFLFLGLVLRKPLERFMKLYVSKVEECGIME